MQNPCSCHWLELTDFLSTSRSSRKDKEIWEISSLAAIWEPAGARHAAPTETVAACPLACRWHHRRSIGLLNLVLETLSVRASCEVPTLTLRHSPGAQILFSLVDLFSPSNNVNVFLSGFFPFRCSDKQSSERR